MLLNISKIALLIVVLIYTTGCTRKSNNYSRSYHSSEYSYKQNSKKKNTNTSNTKIRNSKAMHRATMKPYTVMGHRYYPKMVNKNDTFHGVASWYGPDFHAKKTSNGEVYNMYAMTAAHKTLPMNTMVKVKNVDNGMSVIVRVNDRGPFVKQRIIDLSNVAAHKIDMVKKGTANVKLTIVGFNGNINGNKNTKHHSNRNSKYYLQVGVFSKVESANAVKRKFEMIMDKEKYKFLLKNDNIDDTKVTRIWIAGFKSEQEAYDFKDENQLDNAMVIVE